LTLQLASWNNFTKLESLHLHRVIVCVDHWNYGYYFRIGFFAHDSSSCRWSRPSAFPPRHFNLNLIQLFAVSWPKLQRVQCYDIRWTEPLQWDTLVRQAPNIVELTLHRVESHTWMDYQRASFPSVLAWKALKLMDLSENRLTEEMVGELALLVRHPTFKTLILKDMSFTMNDHNNRKRFFSMLESMLKPRVELKFSVE